MSSKISAMPTLLKFSAILLLTFALSVGLLFASVKFRAIENIEDLLLVLMQ